MIRSPGYTANIGISIICSCALWSILPQDDIGSFTPKPKKLSDDSVKIALAILILAATIIDGIMFGIIIHTPGLPVSAC